jgi:GT2 family glycosyltransferase
MNKNKTRPILDIAILTAGRVDLFEKCVGAVLTQMRPEYKIYVCNNGHPSEDYERIYRLLPEGSVVKRNNQDGGFGVGANTAINAGNAPLVLFITDDVFIHGGSIEKLLETMKDQTIGLCGYKLLFPEDSTEPSRPAGMVQHVGMASNIRGEIIHPLIGWSPDHPKTKLSREVLAVTGASFMVRRAVFNRARGFNPIYGKGYYEDTDLCFTIRSQGSRIYCNCDATATHGVGQTFKNEQNSPIQQNRLTFTSKWISQMPWSEFEFW